MYSMDGCVRFSEIAEDGKLSYLALINYLQDCCTAHSESRNRGPAHVRTTGHAWMLASWLIEVEKLPSFNSKIQVTTWPTGFKRLWAWRNFTIVDEAGELCCRANSSWFMFDLHTGHPMHLSAEEIDPYKRDVAEPLDLPEMAKKIRPVGSAQMTEPLVVTHSMIDTNHHMNNSQYLSVCLAALEDVGYQLPAPPIRLEMQFRKAAHKGDHIQPIIYAQEKPWVIIIEDESHSQLCALRIESLNTAEE